MLLSDVVCLPIAPTNKTSDGPVAWTRGSPEGRIPAASLSQATPSPLRHQADGISGEVLTCAERSGLGTGRLGSGLV